MSQNRILDTPPTDLDVSPILASDEAGRRISAADRAKGRRFIAILSVAIAVAFLALGATTVTLYRQYTRWDPLGQYPPQQGIAVIDRLPGGTAPAVSLSSGVVHVSGQKCNNSDETIRVQGSLAWVLVEPPGTVYPIDGSPAVSGKPVAAPTRIPGCAQRDYTNPIPDSVAKRVEALAKEGRTETIWAITGIETPESDDGESGVPRSWSTSNFTIVYDGPIPVP